MANTHSLDLESSSSQYASISDASQTGLDITGNFSIECWVKRESTGQMTMVSKYNSTGNASYVFFFNTSHQLQCIYSDDGSEVAGHLTNGTSDGTVTADGNWHHVAATVNAAGKTITFYIDTIAQTTTVLNNGAGSVFNGTAPFVVGNTDTFSNYFDGLIDEVRVWNTERTSGEITANYQVELVGNESGLAAYYKLNNNYTDATSNNNTLTASGSPVFSSTVPFLTITTAGGAFLQNFV